MARAEKYLTRHNNNINNRSTALIWDYPGKPVRFPVYKETELPTMHYDTCLNRLSCTTMISGTEDRLSDLMVPV